MTMERKQMIVYFAHYDSRNFSFDAFGQSAAEAKKALLDGLKEHAYQYASRIEDEHWWYDEDIWVEERTMGCCYRDNALIKKRELT